jgi:flagellar basal body P-ring formation protein FlgA
VNNSLNSLKWDFFLDGYFLMNAFRMATSIALGTGLFATLALAAPAPTLSSRLEQAARAQLDKQVAGAGLAEPRFELALVPGRVAPPCAEPVQVEPLDTRQPARMRFLARCPEAGGWQYEYIVRAKISALVAVAAAPVQPNQPLSEDQVTLERRDVTAIGDAIGATADAVGQASRRSLRVGDILRSSQLVAPVLVKRGDQVVMVAHSDQVEVSMTGEALDAGSRGATVRVRNGASGQVVRMRVTGPGTVEPVDKPLTR